MNCCYCDRPLVCDSCQRPYQPSSAKSFQSLYQPEYPVICTQCEETLRCRSCGAVYSGSDEEYSNEARE